MKMQYKRGKITIFFPNLSFAKKIPVLWIRRRIPFEETPFPKTEVVTPVYKLTTSSDWSLMISTKKQ